MRRYGRLQTNRPRIPRKFRRDRLHYLVTAYRSCDRLPIGGLLAIRIEKTIESAESAWGPALRRNQAAAENE